MNILKLAHKPKHKETLLLKNSSPSSGIIHSAEHFSDFQEFLITNLLLFCQKAQFTHLPLEQLHVSKLEKSCDKSVNSHFQTKPVLHFNFAPETVPLVLAFLNNLDFYSDYFDMSESKEFYDSRFTDLTDSRNAYLNHWQLNIDHYRKEQATANWYYERERTAM